MIDPALMRAMLNAGCTADQIVAVAEDAARAVEERKADQRAKNAERQRRFRNARNALHGVTNEDNALPVSPKKETSPTPPKEKTTPSISPSVVRAQFEEFWVIFPNKVGKRDAEKVFMPALQRASFESILSGLKRYVAKTDDRPWCNPATFLNQDRWADQPASAVPRQSTPPPAKQTHNDILDAIIRGEPNVPPNSTPTIDASYERGDGSSAPGAVRLYAVSSRS